MPHAQCPMLFDLQTFRPSDMRPLPVIVLLLMMISASLSGQEYTVMFYNTENLFDTVDDTLRDDNEFLPGGSRHWTYNRYRQKLNSIARVITAAGEWEPPVLVGLCEVENESVVKDLVRSPVLEKAGYGFVHRESPDPRGIDLALLYRHDIVRVSDVRSWIPLTDSGEVFDSRNLLYVKSSIGRDTLHLILCHWPSRRGGVLAAAELRERMAKLVRIKTDSLQASSVSTASIIVMGDFNATPSDEIISGLTAGNGLINLSTQCADNGEGSYKYQGVWELIDQIIITDSMNDTTGLIYADPLSFRVFKPPFLIVDDPDYPGTKPFSTYNGFRWSGGYSDHLPVMFMLKMQ